MVTNDRMQCVIPDEGPQCAVVLSRILSNVNKPNIISLMSRKIIIK